MQSISPKLIMLATSLLALSQESIRQKKLKTK